MAEDKNSLVLKNENEEILTPPIKIWKNQVKIIDAITHLTDCTVESTNEAVKVELISQEPLSNNEYRIKIKLTGINTADNVSIKIIGTYRTKVLLTKEISLTQTGTLYINKDIYASDFGLGNDIEPQTMDLKTSATDNTIFRVCMATNKTTSNIAPVGCSLKSPGSKYMTDVYMIGETKQTSFSDFLNFTSSDFAFSLFVNTDKNTQSTITYKLTLSYLGYED